MDGTFKEEGEENVTGLRRGRAGKEELYAPREDTLGDGDTTLRERSEFAETVRLFWVEYCTMVFGISGVTREGISAET